MNPEEEIVRTASVPVDVLRITPLRDRIPQHDQATVWRLHGGASLALLARIALPPIRAVTGPIRAPERRGVLAGLLTDEDFDCTAATDYLDRLLTRHRADGMTVETWFEIHPGGQPASTAFNWGYTLLPVLVRIAGGPADWPPEEPPGITVRIAGQVYPNPRHADPTPRPYPGPPQPLNAGTYVRQAFTSIPPPNGHRP